MKFKLFFAAAGAAVFLAPPAMPADILGACEADIVAYCAEVEPGNGRIAACLYAYEDKLSEPCDKAMSDTADVIDLFFDRLRYVKQQCGADIRTYCSEVELGQGRLFTCLAEKRSEISAECGEVIDNIELPEG